MTSLAIVIGLGFMLSRMNRELGMFDVLITGFGGHVPAFLLPMTIAFPIFMPLAISMGQSPVEMIAAVMNGIAMGYSLCFYADTTTAGTGVSSISIIKTTIPYAIGITVLTCIGLVVCG